MRTELESLQGDWCIREGGTISFLSESEGYVETPHLVLPFYYRLSYKRTFLIEFEFYRPPAGEPWPGRGRAVFRRGVLYGTLPFFEARGGRFSAKPIRQIEIHPERRKRTEKPRLPPPAQAGSSGCPVQPSVPQPVRILREEPPRRERTRR